MAAPTYVGEAYEATWSSTTSPKTSSSISVTAGDLLVAVAGGSSSNGALTISDSAGLTWTTLANTTGSKSPIRAYYATVATTGSLTVTVTRASGSSYYGFNVVQFRTHGGVGATNNTANGSGAPSVSFTTTGANSAVVWINGDIGSGSSSGTWRSVNGTPTVIFEGTPSSTFHAATWTDAGTAGAKTLGLSAPSQDWSAIAIEVLARTSTHVTGELLPVGASSGGHVTGQLLPVGSTSQVEHVVGQLLPIGAQSVARVTGLCIPIGAEAGSLGTWHEMVRTAEFIEAITDRDRILDSYTEFVDMRGLTVPVEVEGEMFERAPAEDVTVGMKGEQAEQWSGTASFGSGMVPTSLTSPLDPRNGLRLRLWWGVLHKPSQAWLWACCGTLLMEDPKVTDSGIAAVTVTLRDMLTMLSGAGYGGQPLDISGLYVHEAIRAIIDRAAPTLPVRIAVTDRKVPATYEVAYQSALTDIIDLAERAGWVVRTDADGVVNVGPRAAPLTVVVEWSEGDDCPVEDLTRDITTSLIRNRVTVRSTHPDAVGVYYTAEDDDPSSPTYVYGPWGAHPADDVETDVSDTVEGCKSIALMRLGRLLHPTEDVEVTVMPRPDLGYRDAVNVRRRAAGTTGGYRVSSWDGLRLPRRGQEPPAMKVRMMTRTLE